MRDEFTEAMAQVIASLRAEGYDPYQQLTGYLTTGNLRYITRAGNARALVKGMDRERLRQYVERRLKGNRTGGRI